MRSASYPISIVWFERLYIGSIFLAVIQAVLDWASFSNELEFSSDMFGSGVELVVSVFLIALAAILVVGLTFCLWFYIVKRPRALAKWAFVILFGFDVFALPFFVMEYTSLEMLITIAVMILDIGAIILLFRPDAKRWFETNGRMDDKRQQTLSDVFQ